MPVYNPPTGRYTSRIPPGTAGFRKLLIAKFGFTRTEVVRDRSRCQAKGSEHCECRGIDAFTTNTALGNRVFDWCVANAEKYGIQSVIFQNREWGFGRWFERFRKKRDHFDHVHVGLNLKGAGSPVEGDWFDMATEAELRKVVAEEVKKGLTTLVISKEGGTDWTVKGFLLNIWRKVKV